MRLLWLFLLIAGTLRATNYYVLQNGAGTQSGLSIGNAWSVANHNAATLAPGDTVFLNGTLTGTVEAPSSGSAGLPITYVFATGAKFSSAAWPITGAFKVVNKSYITLDGGATGTIGGYGATGSTNGYIENTANGTGLANAITSCGVYVQETKHCIIKNLLIQNIYVRSGTTDTTDGGAGINSLDSNGNGVSDLLVTNCIIHDAHTGVYADFGPSDHDYTFTNNTVYNTNWGITCGGRGGSSTLTTVTIHDNYFHDWAKWNDTATNAFHHNGVFIFADGASESVSGINVYANVFGPGFGNGYQTSGIYINAHIQGANIYNNLFVCGAGEYVANGLITLSSQVSSTFNVFNNTFVCAGSGTAIQIAGSGNGATVAYNIENNLGSGGGGGTYIALYSNANVTLVSNYNVGYNYSSSLGYSYSTNGSAVFKTYAQWQGLGYDLNSVTGNPMLTAAYGLSAGSPAIGTGTDLSAYFTTDAAGYTRTVPWDIGAYKYIPPTTSLTGNASMTGNASFK